MALVLVKLWQTDAVNILNLPFAQTSKSSYSNELFLLLETCLEKMKVNYYKNLVVCALTETDYTELFQVDALSL